LGQKKHNSGALATPFGAELKCTQEARILEMKELDASELAVEGALNATDWIELAREDGLRYPEELAEETRIVLKTVRNALTHSARPVG
jgi:hypothetical protein